MMKHLIVGCTLFVLLLVAANAWSWDMTWQNTTPWFGPDGVTPIAPGGMVQLIADGGNGVIDDPWKVLPWSVFCLEWRQAGCPPVGPDFYPEYGDDYLVESTDAPNPTFFRDNGPGYDGYFDAVYIQANLPPGTKLYTRFFTAAEPDVCDSYGTIGVHSDSDFYVLPDEAFPLYIIDVAATADIHPLGPYPEPGTMLIGCVAILIGVVKIKKRAKRRG